MTYLLLGLGFWLACAAISFTLVAIGTDKRAEPKAWLELAWLSIAWGPLLLLPLIGVLLLNGIRDV